MLTAALPPQAFLQNLQAVLATRLEIITRAEPGFAAAQHTETILERIIGAEPTVNWRRWIAGTRVLMEETLKLPSHDQPPAEVLAAMSVWSDARRKPDDKKAHIEPVYRVIETSLLLYLGHQGSEAPASSVAPKESLVRLKTAAEPYYGPIPDKGTALAKRIASITIEHPHELIPKWRSAIEAEATPMGIVRLFGGEGLGKFILSNKAFRTGLKWEPISLSETSLRDFFHWTEVIKIAVKIIFISSTDFGTFPPQDMQFMTGAKNPSGDKTFLRTWAGGVVRGYHWKTPESKEVDGYYGIGVLTDLREG